MGIWISIRTAILRIKKELPVLEYIDRGYMVTFYRQTNSAAMPAITINDYTYTPTIY